MSERGRFRRVAVLMGGPSAEREVSLSSGEQCAAALREVGYEVEEVDAGADPAAAAQLAQRLAALKPDAAFNALHGRFGEDGCVQGLLEWMGLPYTHSGVAASALAIDKIRAKSIFAAHGLRVAEHVSASPEEAAAEHLMAPPYVLKPVAEGSSIGVHIVRDGANRPPDLTGPDAPAQVMAERYVPGRELTVTVMDGRALGVTEIIAPGWYDYAAKYSEGGSRHVLPAEAPADVLEAAMAAAVTAHQALGCRGVTRSDFRYDDQSGPGGREALTILETNTQPGMTPTSLAPEQAAAVGVGFAELCAWILEDASLRR